MICEFPYDVAFAKPRYDVAYVTPSRQHNIC